jgi:alpha-glucosidase (family GH31 glycosyl hydrolase)
VAEVSRKVLGWRLKALPYLYSAFYDSHTFGCPIARPLWFVFPTDATTLRLHEQWMMGEPSLPSGRERISTRMINVTVACRCEGS